MFLRVEIKTSVSGAALNHEKYVPILHFIPFHLQELVTIENEFEECKSSGRATNTPVYRITNVSAYGSFWLENEETKEKRKEEIEQRKLMLFPGQKINGLRWDVNEKGQCALWS